MVIRYSIYVKFKIFRLIILNILETICHMPLQRSLARHVAKLKQPVHEINPNNFNAVDQIVLPDEELEIVLDPSQQPQSILLFDSGPEDPNRLLIFSNNVLIEIAQSATSFQMDGTFSKCPKVYNDGRHNNGQLLTIAARIRGFTLPVFYCLMKQRTSAAYVEVFQAILQRVNLAPLSFMTDLELAMSRAISEIFPNCEHTLCYYHFQESLYSWICSNGLKTRYLNDVRARKFLHKFGCLAFLPMEKVLDGWRLLNEELLEFEEDDEIESFVNYFSGSFIGRMGENNRRMRPRHDPMKWNQYQRTMNLEPRTNNALEGWHNSLNHLNYADHPNMFRLLKIIKEDMHRTRVYFAQNNPRPKKRTYRDLDVSIKNLCQMLGENPCDQMITNFLTAASNLYNFY